jgi:hypothetical protein
MPSVQRLPAFEPRRSIEEFIQLRREMLRYARAFPPGAERNQRRQIALSLRGLFKNKAWLDTHVVATTAPRLVERLPLAILPRAVLIWINLIGRSTSALLT